MGSSGGRVRHALRGSCTVTFMWGERVARAAVVAAALVVAGAPAAAFGAEEDVRRDERLFSFDGTRILTHFFPAPEAARDGEGRAPTVLLGHGWGGSGATEADDPVSSLSDDVGGVGVGQLLEAGYNVVTWDARGFGRSSGRAQVDSPEYEGRDVQMIIDWVAAQPEALLDAAGDPRVGMAGASYGGGIQLVVAAIDRRVDAITPTIAWHDLENALIPARDFRWGWGSLLTGGGLAAGALAPEITQAYDATWRTGRVRQQDYDWFEARGPKGLVASITAPTLIVQGTVDTLFTLRDGVKNYEMLRAAGTPARMVWFCGGHGVCSNAEPGPDGEVARATLAWLDRWLRGRTEVETGAPFTWLADDGRWRDAPTWPPPPGAPLRGEGGGRLTLRPGFSSGAVIAASPAQGGVTIPIPTPAAADVVGAPRLTLTYRGSGWPRRDTHIHAQIVRRRPSGARHVIGNQASPIPLWLSRRPATVEIALEPIAARVEPGDELELQLVDSSALFDAQRTWGSVDLTAAVELPTAAAARLVAAGEPAPAG